jgi:hypothetical protein
MAIKNKTRVVKTQSRARSCKLPYKVRSQDLSFLRRKNNDKSGHKTSEENKYKDSAAKVLCTWGDEQACEVSGQKSWLRSRSMRGSVPRPAAQTSLASGLSCPTNNHNMHSLSIWSTSRLADRDIVGLHSSPFSPAMSLSCPISPSDRCSRSYQTKRSYSYRQIA